MKERIAELMGRHADGVATASEMSELDAALRADRTLRRDFLRYMNVDAMLGGVRPELRVAQSGNAVRKRACPAWAAAAAAAVVLVLAVVLLRQNTRPAVTTPVYATLEAATDAVWADPNTELALRSGELPTGALRLESGSAQFHFVDGATMILNGPASIRVPERKRIFVESGRIFVRCPSPESRLTVGTNATEIVDLGTEFAVESRIDRSTFVAVLSGEVNVGKSEPRKLRRGEAVEVRGDRQLVLKPLAPDDFARLLTASPSGAEFRSAPNLLRDAGFENGLSDATWSGTEPNLSHVRGAGRTGAAVVIASNARAHWPQCRQKLDTGDISGRMVIASAWAAPEMKLRPKQTAVLKVVFVNAEGRDFAFAQRRFLDSRSVPGQFEKAEIAAFAPAGTRSVQLQLMFQTDVAPTGAVRFDDASLVVADTP